MNYNGSDHRLIGSESDFSSPGTGESEIDSDGSDDDFYLRNRGHPCIHGRPNISHSRSHSMSPVQHGRGRGQPLSAWEPKEPFL